MDARRIGSRLTVQEALTRWPALVAVFLRHRMACPGCPMARFLSLSEAAGAYGLSAASFLAELRLEIRKGGTPRATEIPDVPRTDPRRRQS
jgi:hybrid cluster-associated redox disulfide protein